jgi:hypothetical protein
LEFLLPRRHTTATTTAARRETKTEKGERESILGWRKGGKRNGEAEHRKEVGEGRTEWNGGRRRGDTTDVVNALTKPVLEAIFSRQVVVCVVGRRARREKRRESF